MSVFSEILIKINDISKDYVKTLNDDLESALRRLDVFEEEYLNERSRGREKTQKDKTPLTALQSINEDEDESKTLQNDKATSNPIENGSVERTSTTSNSSRRGSKKRNKNEVDGIDSPKQDKRQKRNASAKASANIAKQVNLNLNQKLRRDVEPDVPEKVSLSTKGQKQKEDDKENMEPFPMIIQIKQEKISLPPEPVDVEPLPFNVEVKKKMEIDAFAMPPPVAPMPKPRKLLAKEKSQEDMNSEETSNTRSSTRTRKQTDNSTQGTTDSRSLRSSARSARHTQTQEQTEKEARPKRTRAKKKVSQGKNDESEDVPSSQESVAASPADKPRPKRTRRVQKATAKEEEKPVEALISPKKEKLSHSEVTSPILQKDHKQKSKRTNKKAEIGADKPADEVDLLSPSSVENAELENVDPEVTRVIQKPVGPEMAVPNKEMDQTVVLPNGGVYDHAPVTPREHNGPTRNLNETVVLETRKESDGAEKKENPLIMDATVIIERLPASNAPKISEDNSLLTNDSDADFTTPPKGDNNDPKQPTSAVKERVQQFEELATRVTRTKTRAMAKKEQEPDNQTPPDKMIKPVLSTETLNKMNSLIFNGKPLQVSSSASKPHSAVPVAKSSASASKASAIRSAREAEEGAKREKEDARRKKEALLEAKREMHRKKREEKMAAAAAARVAAERERRLAVEAMERERREKQAQADQGRVDRLKEAERKKQEFARKVAETEERRRAEEQARQARLAEEQRKADALRRKQIEEAEAMKKEAAIMAREIEKRKKEYNEKQKMKHNRHDDKMHTPLKCAGAPPAMEPVYMLDGFQYLNSDEDEDKPVSRPIPAWSTSKARHAQLAVQTRVNCTHVDRLFSVRVHSPDLREIFPNIDRARLKRTSSAVWRTPPNRMPPVAE